MDVKIVAGEKIGLLIGILIVVKDNICIRGIFIICGFKIL